MYSETNKINNKCIFISGRHYQIIQFISNEENSIQNIVITRKININCN